MEIRGQNKELGKEIKMVNQLIIEDSTKRNLKRFADDGIAFLKDNPEYDEVVQQAKNITELEHDLRIPPRLIHPLPEGYEYNFSGFFGQVIGVGRTGIRELHKGSI